MKIELPFRNPDTQFIPNVKKFKWISKPVIQFVRREGCMAHVRIYEFNAKTIGIKQILKEPWLIARRIDTNQKVYTPFRYVIGYNDGAQPVYEADWYCENLPK